MTTKSGQKWSVDDCKDLRSMYMYGASDATIAVHLGRTSWAITCQREKLGLTEQLTQKVNPLSNKGTDMRLHTVEYVTRVDGVDVDKVTDDQLITYIQDIEEQVVKLEGIKVASAAVHAKIDKLTENAKELAKILDQRNAPVR